jgi:hypothetical protein
MAFPIRDDSQTCAAAPTPPARSCLICLWGIAGSILGTVPPAPAQAQLPGAVLSVYSNLCVHPKTGDLDGVRIIVFRSARRDQSDIPDGVYVIYQGTGASFAPPQYAPATIEGNRIRFEVGRDNSFARTFVGRITPDTIEGRYADGLGSPDIRLKRDPAPENRFPDCS